MILRSITRHVREQNWFACGIDFLIVVLGVFIGIQVANSNDERRDSAAEAALLDRLHEEFTQHATASAASPTATARASPVAGTGRPGR